MTTPDGFSWIDEQQQLAGLARPGSVAELTWLRDQGIELLISLTEDPPRRDWINDAGLFLIHVPVEDMTPPTQEQLEQCISVIRKAHGQKRAVAVHCGAGLGRTGVVLACFLVSTGMSSTQAIAHIRKLRAGSVETADQEDAIHQFARRLRQGND